MEGCKIAIYKYEQRKITTITLKYLGKLTKVKSLNLSSEGIVGNVHPTAPAFDKIWVAAGMIGNFAWRKLACINSK